MVARIDLVVHARDLAVLVDQKTHSLGPPRVGIARCAERGRELAVGVAEQLEAEAELFRKRGVLLDRIEARAEDHDFIVVEVALLVAEPATFDGSARGVGLGKEPDQNFTSAQTRKRKRSSLVRHHGEIRSLVANFNHLKDTSCCERCGPNSTSAIIDPAHRAYKVDIRVREGGQARAAVWTSLRSVRGRGSRKL